MKRIPRRIFTAEFKCEAIKLVTGQGLTLAEASRKLDVAKSGYQAWSAGKAVPPRKLEDMRLLVAIKAAHQCGRGTYGPKKSYQTHSMLEIRSPFRLISYWKMLCLPA